MCRTSLTLDPGSALRLGVQPSPIEAPGRNRESLSLVTGEPHPKGHSALRSRSGAIPVQNRILRYGTPCSLLLPRPPPPPPPFFSGGFPSCNCPPPSGHAHTQCANEQSERWSTQNKETHTHTHTHTKSQEDAKKYKTNPDEWEEKDRCTNYIFDFLHREKRTGAFFLVSVPSR